MGEVDENLTDWMLKAATVNFVTGSLVWVEDPEEAWIDGEIVEVNGEDIKINCTTGKTVVANASKVHPKDSEAPPSGVDDMTKLAYLHEPGVLDNLRRRYDINEIYMRDPVLTYTGSILIAVNPFRRLPHLYGNHMMSQYKGAAIGDLSPHPFAIADAAYRLMINEGKSQSILVSGESGAGKTETTKSLMHYLAYMGGTASAEGRSVEQQVLESNPVLEAFGNAKTVRNNNSSRFGKFVELQFDRRGRISGAAIRTYLLERSRVCQVSDPERNYHCFYMLCSAPKEDVERLKLDNPRTFHYLNQSNCYEVDAIDDAKEYIATRRAMDVVGICPDEQDAIFRVVAAILHLGNIEFTKGSESDSSEPKDEKSRFHLRTAAELLMCDEKALEDSLCKRVIVTRGESITKNLDPDAAAFSRDALARIVYSRLVNKINSSIGQDPDSRALIGVLDIYGFESFKTNSFEQFCINLTNEKLQQHFNQHVFKMEQEEYTREEIDWSYIEFVDNQDVLDLIEKRPGGIIALLDEACMFPRSTHETFAQKLYQTFNNHKRFRKPKLSRTDITISHYAGEVTYQTEHFLDKNKDYVVPEHQELLGDSKCEFVASLFPPSPESSKSSKFSSIGTRFKALLETLSVTEPHYIRCIKPNNLLKPSIFENKNVLQQLRCGGVMEAIRISCAGFPTRRLFHEFINRFRVLAPEVLDGSCDEVSASKKILEKVQLKGYQDEKYSKQILIVSSIFWQIGKTKVFLRAGQMAELDALRNEVLGQSAIIIQRKFRTHLFHKWFMGLQWSAIQIQAYCRGQVARYVFAHKKREAACLIIQKDLRRYVARKSYLELYSSASTIQRGMHGMAARSELRFRRQTKAAIVIQSQCRRYIAHHHYMRMRKAAIATQCAWRAKMARRELRKLKMAAKETGALQEAKNKLEKEVDELTWRLQLEKRMRADLEETRKQENAKFQLTLQEMQKQFEETKALLVTECDEAIRRAAEQVPVAQEIPVVDHKLMNELAAENKKLKELLSSMEKKIDETEKKFEETSRLSEERLRQVHEAESKIIGLKTTVQRLEEKIVDIETEYQILRQQALLKSSSSKMAEHQSENGHVNEVNEVNEVNKEILSGTPRKTFRSETMRKSQIERQRNSEDNFLLAYWLSNTSTLLFLLQRSLKAKSASKPPQPTSFFGRMAQGFRSSSANIHVDIVRPVEARYPALLFKQQLAAYVEKIFGIIKDNLKKELSPLLSSCIQAPRTEQGAALRRSLSNMPLPPNHWQNIVETLDSFLSTLEDNHVPKVLIQKIFTQTFSYINVQLFNSLLLRRECCTFSNGEYVKAGLVDLEAWCKATGELAGSSWDELMHIRQAVGFLVIHQKSRITYDDIKNDLCPALSVQQLYKICTLYWDDNYNTRSVSQDVISSMRKLMTEENANEEDNNSAGNTFLLDDDCSGPFSVDDLSASQEERDFAGVKPPAELLENPDFQFLKD
ncbi:hypothetical protein Cgig2_013964 [Carnegiea gigantea]|uniref:Uncharacterized protein n=1 Tax=Carnegiea gigantea TaxID=171969 RepID=A0A9Q1KX29_9CARY|nr:hypothetical protein Cgig2_013964 [Carnegiea gigantea]